MTLLSYRKPTLLALGALIAGCAFAAPSAHAQANLTFSGGSGNPLSLTLANPVTYIVTTTTSSAAPIFVFDGTGNFASGFLPVSGNVTFTVNGGTPFILDTLASGFSGGSFTTDDSYLFSFSSFPGLTVGDVVVLNAGTLTTTGTFAGAAPASGSFATFIAQDNPPNQVSTLGVAGAAAAVPEPSQYAMGGMLGASLLFGMVKARRRTARTTAKKATATA